MGQLVKDSRVMALPDWSDPSILDVSHGDGIPIGGLGTGYSVFGPRGFHDMTFAGSPALDGGHQAPCTPAPFAFYLLVEEQCFVLQTAFPSRRPQGVRSFLTCMERVTAHAALPKSHFCFEHGGLPLGLTMTAYSPLIAHDLEASTTPVQIFELTLENRARVPVALELGLWSEDPVRVADDAALVNVEGGEVALGVDAGRADERGATTQVRLEPAETRTVRFYLAWHVPEFRTPSPVATATYRRLYTRRFPDASAVLRTARERAGEWSRAIDAWRASFDVPPPMKRLWFSSLASVITSTLLSDDPFFFAVEVPHEWVNTMDVAVYANWVYLVNWPELERMDLEQYLSVIPKEGAAAGFVWHSLWSDAVPYAEEPTFLTRLYRAHLWFNDPAWLEQSYSHALAAATHAYQGNRFEELLTSERGNQSYDEWMMPGASAYVNVAWLYALHALERMGQRVGRPALIAGRSASEIRSDVARSLETRLWSDAAGGYYRCFHRTPGVSDASVPEAIFSDQLFGRWVLLIDEDSDGILPPERVVAALRTVYTRNAIEDPTTGFRGWVNGMLPSGAPDLASGYHARTCWLGAELDLASLLASAGDEEASLDVFYSIERSLFGNHLAVGEWNRAVGPDRQVIRLATFGKDTPRFPPYPRYTSSWEYLIRMLGLTLTEQHLSLRPLKSLTFELHELRLAEMTLSVRVEAGWKHVVANGRRVDAPPRVPRDAGTHRLEFVTD
jgi:uncharacterized protein (DUF608 family)